MTTKASDLGPPRWRGQPHRLEVWYATFTDPRTTDGYWLHHEMVAPDEGAAYAHGWCAVFPFDGPPRGERFGPAPPDPGGDAWFSAAGAHVDGAVLRGAAGDLTWDLAYADTSAPLYTFPSWSWEQEGRAAAVEREGGVGSSTPAGRRHRARGRVGGAGLHRSRRCHRDVHEQRAGRRRDRVAVLGRRLARRPALVVARHGPRRGGHAPLTIRPVQAQADVPTSACTPVNGLEVSLVAAAPWIDH